MIWVLLVFVFIVGACVGSFLNVAIARLPLEKSLLWPSSRCGACLQPIRSYDNLPLISYLWLRGRCRSCGQSYSIVYLLVELATGLGFAGLFWLEVVRNIHGWPGHRPFAAEIAVFPLTTWLGFLWHAALFSFLMVASVCDLRSREIPLQLTLTGTLIGLIGSICMPWPMPHDPAIAAPPPVNGVAAFGWQVGRAPLEGIYPWPFWGPLPAWFAPGGNWQTGLATGVLGALVGTFLLRIIGFVFSKGLGKDALGLGDADLMMMAGAFLGWQVVVVSFFLSVIPALVFGIILWVVRNDRSLPFGPSLSASVMVTCLAWKPIGQHVRAIFFWGDVLLWGSVLCLGVMFLMAALLKFFRGNEA